MKRKFHKKITIEDVKLDGLADKGKSVGRTQDGMVVFVENGVPGDVVDVLVSKKKGGYAEGKATVFKKLSDERVIPFCQHFNICGGCKWQHLSYESQLKYKEKMVRDTLIHLGKVPLELIEPILPALDSRFYRNKMEYGFSNKRWLTEDEIDNKDVTNMEDVLGFHRPGSFDKLVDILDCHLQADPANNIRNTLRDIAKSQKLSFYDNRSKKGDVRHAIIRTSTIGETMLNFVFGSDDMQMVNLYLEAVASELPEITTLCYTLNTKLNDYVMDLPIYTYKGLGYIHEMLGTKKFRIGPKSFFQTNTKQAERLFDTVVDFADFKGTENVYDLYTGLGSIAIYVSDKVKHVVGIEEISEAIEDAKLNAALNNIDNTTFYAGDVKDILTEAFAIKHGKPDILITDPPRAGMHEKVLKMLLELESPKIIYVSCNPATQARDLIILQEKYEVVRVRPVDMFPHTHHIENIALLHIKS